MVMAMALVGSGGLGWLMGPFLGNEVFEILHRKVGPQIAEVSCFFRIVA